MHDRDVEFAFGNKDGTWTRITVHVPERDDYVLDLDEVVERALDTLYQIWKEEVLYTCAEYDGTWGNLQDLVYDQQGFISENKKLKKEMLKVLTKSTTSVKKNK